jgi:pilus assembly protein CpaF
VTPRPAAAGTPGATTRPTSATAPHDPATLDPTGRLHRAVLDRVAVDDDVATRPADRPALRRAVARALAAEGVVLAPQAWARAVRDLVDEVAGLGPVEALLRDPRVTDVCVNGPDEVWVDRGGAMERTDVAFRDDGAMLDVVRRVLGPTGRRLDRGHPFADAVLDGGVRLHALLPPLSERPVLTLRRIPPVVPTWDELAAAGTVPADLRRVLRDVVGARHNVVVAGRAGAGKTTLLKRLLGEVADDRVVVLEDTPELGRPCRHAVSLQTVEPGPDGTGGVDLGDLLRNALRMRPDRLVVGEVRGVEVAGLLQAMNTGHSGSATTVHANGAADALVRLEGMALLSGTPLAAARAQVDTAVDVVVMVGREGHRRRVTEVVAVECDVAGARHLDHVWAPS